MLLSFPLLLDWNNSSRLNEWPYFLQTVWHELKYQRNMSFSLDQGLKHGVSGIHIHGNHRCQKIQFLFLLLSLHLKLWLKPWRLYVIQSFFQKLLLCLDILSITDLYIYVFIDFYCLLNIEKTRVLLNIFPFYFLSLLMNLCSMPITSTTY